MTARILAVLLAAAALAAAADPLPLWPHGAPDETPGLPPEHDTTKATDQLIAGRRLIRLGDVSNPTITVYAPAAAKNSGAAVVVFPGGGYSILALDLEGTEVCQWLNSIGVTGVLLKYRVPARQGRPRYAAALQDAQRALGMVRARAAEWHIDPRRIGVLGFSAGGHLAAALSTNYEKRTYDPVDAADQVSCRPDFAVILYPGYLVEREHNDRVAPELAVTAATPPTFLVQAEDDPVHVENSVYYFVALKNAKVPAEMHLFAQGGHGYGLRRTNLPVTSWPDYAERWFHTIGVLQ